MAKARTEFTPTRRLLSSGLLFEAALGVLLALIVFSWIYLFPESASRLGREMHYGILLPLLICVLGVAAFQIRDIRLPACSFVLLAAFFLLQLRWLWFAGPSDTMLIGGFIPFSDASDYLINARVLASGVRIQGQGHGNDHSLASAMLAVLWKGTHGDYRLILVFIALFDATSAWLAMTEVSLLLGPLAGVVFLLVDILFLRRFIGVPLSEHLGMILANLGMALGCRAARTGREYCWLLMTFALSLALCARSGAVLTIPALVVGAFLALPKKGAQRWIIPCALAGAALMAFALDKFVSQAVGSRSPDAAISNAVYHLYSQVYGGEWTDAMNRYGNDRLAVWHAVELQLRTHPFSLFSGGERSLLAIISQGYLFSFVGSRWLNIVLHLAFAAAAVAVVLALPRDRRAWWLFALLGGLFFSMPLLPPWNTDNMRVYAATVPLLAFSAAFGVCAGIMSMRALRLAPARLAASLVKCAPYQPVRDDRVLTGWISIGMLAAVVVLCAFLPPLFRPHAPSPFRRTIENTYNEHTHKASIRYLPHIVLRLVPDSMPPGGLTLRVGDFRSGLTGFARLYPGEAALLESLPDECVLLPSSEEFSFIAIDAAHVTNPGNEQTLNLKFHFIAVGWLLVAVDESLLARSPALRAYDTAAIGFFSFGINRFPVIRAGDTITLAENVVSIEFLQPPHTGLNINAIKPFVVGSHRLRFPVPGEYYLRLNHDYPLKLLVIGRESSASDSNRMIVGFVQSNSVMSPNDAERNSDGSTAFDPVRFFESEAPTPLSRRSVDALIALLDSSAGSSVAH